MDRNSKGEKSATTPKVHFTYNRPITELHMTFSLQSVSPLLLKYSLEYLPDSAKGRGIGPSSSMMWAMWSINTQGVKTHTAVLFISLHAEFHYYSVVFLYCSSVCSRGARFRKSHDSWAQFDSKNDSQFNSWFQIAVLSYFFPFDWGRQIYFLLSSSSAGSLEHRCRVRWSTGMFTTLGCSSSTSLISGWWRSTWVLKLVAFPKYFAL